MISGERSCMNCTCVGPSVSGRPPSSESRPKDTSLGRGRGRDAVAVSRFDGRGEAGGGGGEDESARSRRGADMLAVTARGYTLYGLCAGNVDQPGGLTESRGPGRCDWKARRSVSGRGRMSTAVESAMYSRDRVARNTSFSRLFQVAQSSLNQPCCHLCCVGETSREWGQCHCSETRITRRSSHSAGWIVSRQRSEVSRRGRGRGRG